ncbi:MAG: NAD(P)-dependent oxidoreductase [Lacibacter sp.]
MRIIVTGSNGFIGRSLVKQLLTGKHEVCVLVRNKTVQPQVNTISYNDSLLDCADDVQSWKPDVFFHLAWRGVDNTQRNSEENNLYNYRLTIDSVKLAKEAGCKQWIGAGSQAEYGVANSILSETENCKPVTGYGSTKQKLCNETQTLCSSYNMVHSWARIFSVYGPNDHQETLISYLIKTMFEKEVPQVSSCTQHWDYLFVNDAAAALGSLINHAGVYNIASGKTVVLKEVVETIQQLTGYKGEIQWGYKPDAALHFLCGSIEKISRNTGWSPIVSLNEGLAKTILNYNSSI